VSGVLRFSRENEANVKTMFFVEFECVLHE